MDNNKKKETNLVEDKPRKENISFVKSDAFFYQKENKKFFKAISDFFVNNAIAVVSNETKEKLQRRTL